MVSVPSGGDTWIYDGYEANLKLTTKDIISSATSLFKAKVDILLPPVTYHVPLAMVII
jgi:hypothetical protein